ncbi:MAG: 5-formyltetrahydrofolate cyclo-ligase [Endomicrobium sp.]|nr:5-formyltetrahydrofolate cyclo-ligase [Endomicrobium sp.]
MELEKRKVRCEFLALRDNMTSILSESYSAVIVDKIKKLCEYKKAKTVMFYLSCGLEVITDFIIRFSFDEGKTVVVPAVENSEKSKTLVPVKILEFGDICKCKLVYGVKQPEINKENIVEKNDIDLVFVPGVAFDTSGYRIGYGKGFYDRWLKDVLVGKIVGLAYDFQITSKLPIGEYDLPVGMVVTEKRIIYKN